jgi:hypothetical protein
MNDIEIFFIMVFITAMGLFLAGFFVRRAKFKEKMILIEKGIDIKDLNLLNEKRSKFPWLKIGIVITCASVGLIIGIFWLRNLGVNGPEGIPMVMMMLFTGIGMIIAHFIRRTEG